MARVSYPGASERELYRTTRIEQKRTSGSAAELAILAVVLLLTAAQLVW